MCCHSNSIGFISKQYLSKKKIYKPWYSRFEHNCWTSRHRCMRPLSCTIMTPRRLSWAAIESFWLHYLDLSFSINTSNHQTINKTALIRVFSERLSAKSCLSTSGSVSKVSKYLSILASREASRATIEKSISLIIGIDNDSDLSDPDKVDLLEQVQAIAEAKQTEEPAKKEGLTRKARKMFEATLSSLPQTESIVEAGSKLWPVILKGLGLPE